MSNPKRENDNMETPAFVKRDGIIADSKYVEWLGEIKQRYQQSQIKSNLYSRRTAAMTNFSETMTLPPHRWRQRRPLGDHTIAPTMQTATRKVYVR